MAKRTKAIATKPPSALSQEDTRQALMLAAGLTPARQAELLTKAVQAAEDSLTAERTVALGNGESATDVDHFSRLAGAKFIRELLGAAPSKTAVGTGGPGQVSVNISLPDWSGPQRVNVTPGPQNPGKASGELDHGVTGHDDPEDIAG